MEKVGFTELLKNNTCDVIRKVFEYTTKSIVPEIYMHKTELVVFGLMILVIFYYIKTYKNNK